MNYTSIERKQQANDFIAFYYRTEGDRKNKLQKLSASFHLTDDAALEDEFIMTLTKCYNKILQKGFEFKKGDGKDFARYFDTALTQNLLQYIKRLKSQTKKENTIDNFNHPYFSFEKSTPAPEFDFTIEVNDKQQVYEDLLREAVESLPEKYREVIYMKVDRMKYQAMERVLGLTNGMVKSRLVTAKKMVKAYMAQRLNVESFDLPDIDGDEEENDA